MVGLSVLSSFSRLSITNVLRGNIRALSSTKQLLFRTSPCLWGEPMKKKRKQDPNISKAKEERKRKKLEKQIRRLEKHALQLKPIDELEIPPELIDEKEKRTRPPIEISYEQKEYRALLLKDWSRFKIKEYMSDVQNIDRIVSSQNRALNALKRISEDLYNAAIEVDLGIYPYSGHGTVATPPIEKYDTPDGEYTDITKNWDN